MKTPRFALFATKDDLLATFLLWNEAVEGAFPKTAWAGADGQWSVALHDFATDEEQSQLRLEHLAGQYGFKLAWDAEPPPGSVPKECAELADDEWIYRDPLHVHRPANAAGYRDVRYILQAADEKQSRQIGHALLACAAPGVRSGAVAPVEARGGEAPMFFWEITHGLRVPETAVSAVEATVPPLLPVLELAARKWWGPFSSPEAQGPQVFLEWPYEFKRPGLADLLGKLCPSGTDSWEPRSLLVSRRAPRHLALGTPPGAAPFREWIELFDLAKPEDLGVALVERQEPPPSGFHLPIRLRLLAKEGRAAEAELDRQLELRIKSLVQQRSRRARLARRAGWQQEVFLEPLLAYAGKPGALPFPLRRLILEWTDQPGDLRALRYLKLPAAPDGWDVGSGTELHLVAPNRALATGPARPDEPDDESMTGVRLLDYAPEGAGLLVFELLPGWAEHNLRLFAPFGRRLELFPKLEPSAEAAHKLAQCLLPPGEQALHDWCAVLLPGPEGALRSVQLPLREFRPLVDAFAWQCQVRVEPLTPATAAPDAARQAADAFVAAVDESFTSAAAERSLQRLDQLHQQIERRQGGIEALLNFLNGLTPLYREVSDQCRALQAIFPAGVKAAAPALLDINDSRQALTVVERLHSAVSAARGRLAALDKQFAETQRQIDQLPNLP